MKLKFAVFGNPIKQSLSPQIHQQFAKQHSLDLEYEKIQSDSDQFGNDLEHFFAQGGIGCNVTMPFKEIAFSLCTELSDHAKRAQAVNTLYKNKAGQLCGHNTDGIGLLQDITGNLGHSIKGGNVIVLGAGGATRGILQPLIDHAPAKISIINRTLAKAESLVAEFSDAFSIDAVAADTIPTDLAAADLLINATSASMDAKLPVSDRSIISNKTVSYDLAYALEPTRFLQWAKECGSTHTHDGRGMLVEQAAAAFTTWNKLDVATSHIIESFENLGAL